MQTTSFATRIAGWGLTLLASTGFLLRAQAPATDRVGFPAEYRQTFTKLLQFDRVDNSQIRVIWGNALAAATPWWQAYPYGSVLLFEAWSSKRDSQGAAMLDDNGRLIPDQLTTVFVQRKERGFGEAYGNNRNGEWEYVSYMPNGTVATAPQNSAACAMCHVQAGPPADYVFRRKDFANAFNPGGSSGAGPRATMSRYAFVPGDLTVKKGTTVTWYNDDEVVHQIASPAGFGSDPMFTGSSFGFKFDQPGTYEVRCTIHPGMRSRVIVE